MKQDSATDVSIQEARMSEFRFKFNEGLDGLSQIIFFALEDVLTVIKSSVECCWKYESLNFVSFRKIIYIAFIINENPRCFDRSWESFNSIQIKYVVQGNLIIDKLKIA